MIITIILFIISILLEGVLPNILRNITPFFVICVIILGSIYNNNQDKFYLSCFVFGIIYDLIYTNFIYLHGFIYLFLAWISFSLLNKKSGFIKIFLTYFLQMFIYVFILVLFTFFYGHYDFYKIIHILCDGIIVNIIYFLLVYLTYFVINCIFKNTNKKYSY